MGYLFMSPRKRIYQSIFSFLFTFLAVQSASAVGVGDITVNSKLGQPISADIKLFTSPSDKVGSIKAKLAPAELYKRTSLDMTKARLLKFEVIKTDSGDVKISVTTTKTYNEPTLDFIIHIIWDDGSIMKQYSLLIDPA